jgi:hypothetical protein
VGCLRGGTVVGVSVLSASILLFWPASAASALPAPSPTCSGGICAVSFAETGTPQAWTVPAGVLSIDVIVAAGSGGSSAGGGLTGAGGAGGKVTARLTETPGHVLSIVVGAVGSNGVVAAVNVPAAGGYGGGAAAGTEQDPVNEPGGGGGGGSFVFDTTSVSLLAAAGGGGGGSANEADPGSTGQPGGAGGAGGDATLAPISPLLIPVIAGGPGTTAGPGLGGPTLGGGAGATGTGPATNDTSFGGGGSGAINTAVNDHGFGTAGGGGGGYYGGGGGATDGPGGINSAGGGGSGFLAAGAGGVVTATNTGNGTVSISYSPPPTTTGGFLRDAATGAAIANSCVVFSPVASPGTTNFTNVNGDSSWSFTTSETGPFNLAFYTTANGDCSQPIQANPVPSWYINQPVTGTDAHTITPAAGSISVAAGVSGVIACLGASALPTTACATPDGALSGTVLTSGPKPLANVCVIALDNESNGVGVAVSDGDGNWSVTGLPHAFRVVVVFLPGANDPGSPCAGGNGPPPVPAAGALQPVFYNNGWINLADPTLLNDPYAWVVAHGATLLTASSNAINACITTAPGTVIPRPSCTPATLPAASIALPATGAPGAPLLASGASLTLLGVLLLRLTARRQQNPSS